MHKRVLLQPAYILHRQPFRNTSLMVDFLTLDHGRVRLVARGARRGRSRHRPLLQPFQPLLISFTGRGEVKTLTDIEGAPRITALQGRRLFSGLYINELLVRLLLNHEEHRALYRLYQSTLQALQDSAATEAALRRFELGLLAELGYGINLALDCSTRLPIEADALYRFTPDVGFRRLAEVQNRVAEPKAGEPGAGEPGADDCFLGAHLLALGEMQQGSARGDGNDDSARAAKRLLRMALRCHLGSRPLHSRRLWK